MWRTILLAVVLPFISAFLGSVLAFGLLVPSLVGRQEPRVRAEVIGVTGATGTDRILLGEGRLLDLDPSQYPRFAAAVHLFDAGGDLRAQVSTGHPQPPFGPPSPGFNVFAGDGVLIGRLGTPPDGVGIGTYLYDAEGNVRLQLLVAEDGTPTIALLDADGSVTWSAP
jgi:hypothetical protein